MSKFFVDTQFPDPQRANVDWDAPCPRFGWPNLAFRSHASSLYYPQHRGTLSIKCAFGGQEVYEIAGRRAVVDDASYLIVNEGQYYASSIDALAEVESFCIFFQPRFARSVLRSLTTPTHHLLDDPASNEGRPVTFLERLYPHDQRVSPLLQRIRAGVAAGNVSPLWLEEQFHGLLQQMMALHGSVIAEVETLPALRPATRWELYQRLSWARDFIEGSYQQPLSLTEIADVACLSPHHFLRLFKQLYRQTPHQYLTGRRLEKARQLLCATDGTVLDICLTVGFSSPSTFTHLFQRHYGLSPSRFRQRDRA